VASCVLEAVELCVVAREGGHDEPSLSLSLSSSPNRYPNPSLSPSSLHSIRVQASKIELVVVAVVVAAVVAVEAGQCHSCNSYNSKLGCLSCIAMRHHNQVRSVHGS